MLKHLLYTLLLYPFFAFGNQGDTLVVRGANSIPIKGYMKQFEDCSNQMDSSRVLRVYLNGRFKQPAAGRAVNMGYTDCSHWFSLTVRNDTTAANDYYWSFYNDGIRFTVYEIDSLDELRLIGSSSNRNLLEERHLPVRMISFHIPMQGYETKRLLLKTDNIQRKNLYFPTDFTTAKDLLLFEVDKAFLLGRYYGFFMYAAVFSLSLFVILRKSLYGYMFGYITSLLVFSLIEHMYDAYFFPDFMYSAWTLFPKNFFIILSLFFYVKVFQRFTLHREKLPRWNRVLNLFNLALLVLSVVCMTIKLLYRASWIHYLDIAMIYSTYIVFAVFIINLFRALLLKNRLVYYFLFCNSLIFIAVVAYILNILNIYRVPVLIRPGHIIVGMAFEIITLLTFFILKYRTDFIRMNNKIIEEQARQKVLSTELINIQENERNIISENLHDGLGNTINALRLWLSRNNALRDKEIKEIFELVNTQFRELVQQNAPGDLDKNGLYRSLEQLLELFRQAPMTFNLTLIGDENLLPRMLKVNIYRIFQELINNVIKHSKANNVEIFIDTNESQFVLQIEDDGIGWDDKKPEGIGIKSIMSRVAYHKGTFHTENLNPGTITIIEIPLQEKQTNN